jgi:uncharacterized protein (TIGR02996 family)
VLEEAIAAAIVAEPGNDLHRMVLADYLDEKGLSDQAACLRGRGFWLVQEVCLFWMPLPLLMGARPVRIHPPALPRCQRCRWRPAVATNEAAEWCCTLCFFWTGVRP